MAVLLTLLCVAVALLGVGVALLYRRLSLLGDYAVALDEYSCNVKDELDEVHNEVHAVAEYASTIETGVVNIVNYLQPPDGTCMYCSMGIPHPEEEAEEA